MNIYQIVYDKHDQLTGDDYETPILLTNEKKYTQKEFQDIIKSEKFSLGYNSDFEDLILELEKYGFERIVTGYFNS